MIPDPSDSESEPLEQQHLFEARPFDADARLILALFYFRRILDLQAVELCVRYFTRLEHFFGASEKDLKRFFAHHHHVRGYVSSAVLADDLQRERAFRYADRVIRQMQDKWHGVLLSKHSRQFPTRLRRFPYPVDWVFAHPAPPRKDERPIIGVAGSRRSTKAQLQVAERLGDLIAASGGRLVTGLATGADIAAHLGFIRGAERRSDGLRDIVAVLGSGLAKAYPTQHRGYVTDLVRSGGAVLTELPPDMNGNAETFVLRNRIIAALSEVVFVVSGEYASGTAHTVRFAKEAGVRVYSVDPSERSGISRLVEELGGSRAPLDDVPVIVRGYRRRVLKPQETGKTPRWAR